MLLLNGHIALRWSAVLRLVVALNIWPRRGQYTITPLRGSGGYEVEALDCYYSQSNELVFLREA